ncbi:ABC transporter ATP-binding protein [Facklamia hominis]|uniref:ABC transporter ATP-binding protein n=1 Tax=Facklamia hominis TaxID=178214 RepID=UPI00101D7621|nr:ABC transporter ATP-binding protein [Facklamia hominis]RYC97551.1 ABC transporter ATP-binding protein [Facklamia hominis]
MPLKIDKVSKLFLNTDQTIMKALEGIDLTINQGEFVSIVGASGSGKSTLLRILAGLIPPTEGQVTLNGERITKPTARIGMAFQSSTLFPYLTVKENITFGPKLQGQEKAKAEAIDAIIKTIGLQGFEKVYPHQLSGGMAQRVSLGRAIVNDPEILLLDEPLGALDAFTRLRLQEELIALWQQTKMTMIMVTHDIDEAIYCSQKVVVMSPRPGRVMEVVPIELDYLRDRTQQDFVDYRIKIMKLLDVY